VGELVEAHEGMNEGKLTKGGEASASLALGGWNGLAEATASRNRPWRQKGVVDGEIPEPPRFSDVVSFVMGGGEGGVVVSAPYSSQPVPPACELRGGEDGVVVGAPCSGQLPPPAWVIGHIQ